MVTKRVKVRLVYEGEYEVQIGSEGYGGAQSLEECLQIDRHQFLTNDHALMLEAVNSVPTEFEVIEVSDDAQ